MHMDKPMSQAERVARRRAKLRAAGLRPVQLWVPDTRTAGFAEECRRQSRLIGESETAATRAEEEAWETASAEAASDDAG
jgi:Antitoxin MazE-like